MRTLMRTPRRYLLFVVVATILLISGISIAASRRTNTTTPVDCAGDCSDSRNKMLERCNGLPDAAASNCRDRANKQYDRCIERCNSGQRGDSRPGE